MTETTKDLQNRINQLVTEHPEVGEWMEKARKQASNRKLADLTKKLAYFSIMKNEAVASFCNSIRDGEPSELQDAKMVVMHSIEGVVQEIQNQIVAISKEL